MWASDPVCCDFGVWIVFIIWTIKDSASSDKMTARADATVSQSNLMLSWNTLLARFCSWIFLFSWVLALLLALLSAMSEADPLRVRPTFRDAGDKPLRTSAAFNLESFLECRFLRSGSFARLLRADIGDLPDRSSDFPKLKFTVDGREPV